jgi:hypothetical protein
LLLAQPHDKHGPQTTALPPSDANLLLHACCRSDGPHHCHCFLCPRRSRPNARTCRRWCVS